MTRNNGIYGDSVLPHCNGTIMVSDSISHTVGISNSWRFNEHLPTLLQIFTNLRTNPKSRFLLTLSANIGTKIDFIKISECTLSQQIYLWWRAISLRPNSIAISLRSKNTGLDLQPNKTSSKTKVHCFLVGSGIKRIKSRSRWCCYCTIYIYLGLCGMKHHWRTFRQKSNIFAGRSILLNRIISHTRCVPFPRSFIFGHINFRRASVLNWKPTFSEIYLKRAKLFN